MQIAGSVKPIEMPDGFVRVFGIDFSPKPTDKLIYWHKPNDWHGPTVDSVLRVIADGAKIRLGAGVLNETKGVSLLWGNEVYTHNPCTVNNRDAIIRSSNTITCLKALGNIAPLTWDNMIEPTWPLIAKKTTGMHGRGKRVWTDPVALHRYNLKHPYAIYQQYIPRRTEWRITVYRDKVISAMRKIPNNPDLTKFREGFDYKRVQVIPRAVSWMAVEAAKRVGLDFAGVDIIQDLNDGRFYCLETNSAPGMSPPTIKRLYMHIQNEFRN